MDQPNKVIGRILIWISEIYKCYIALLLNNSLQLKQRSFNMDFYNLVCVSEPNRD